MRHLVIVLAAALAALALGAAGAGADPNDPAYPDQWGAKATRASDLWTATTGDPKTIIAVVDTGLNPMPDLTHIVPGWDILGNDPSTRSEEHTSELQSRLHLVCRLLLEK